MRVKIICISLINATERRLHMTELLNEIGLSWEFFDAYDGKHINVVNRKIYYKKIFTGYYHDESKFLLDQVEQLGRLHYKKYGGIPYDLNVSSKIEDDRAWIIKDGHPQFFVDAGYFTQKMSNNEIGCALSHIEVIKSLRGDCDYDAYLVLEDDVYLTGDLQKILKQAELYDLIWDVIFLNRPGFGGHPGFIEPNTETEFSQDFNLHVYSQYSSACSYLVNKKLVQDTNHIDLPFDVYLSRCINQFQLRVRREPVFMVDYNKLSGNSTIEN